MSGFRILFCLFAVCWCFTISQADEFTLTDNTTLRGEIASADDDGMVVRLEVGGYARREPWINFSQESLRTLLNDPRTREYVEPFIEPTAEELASKRKKQTITVREVSERIERPATQTSLLGAFLTPAGILLLVILMGANLYSAYEVALYSNQAVPLVCGLAIVLPVFSQILFLSIPGRAEPDSMVADEEFEPAAGAPGGGKTTKNVAAARPSGGLSLAASKEKTAAAALSEPQVYNRGDNTFNRRFFETKFAGFFRVVPSEAERDLVMVVRGVKQEYVGKRISRISSSELHLQLQDGVKEVGIPFAEISTVIIKHKDARV